MKTRLWAVVLLAVIGLHALQPIRAPLERNYGSAFSSATVDVVLASSRESQSAALRIAPSPPPPLPVFQMRPGVSNLPEALPARLRPEARGPPPRLHPASPPDSTAPPLS